MSFYISLRVTDNSRTIFEQHKFCVEVSRLEVASKQPHPAQYSK